MSGLSFGPVPEIGKITIGERNGELCHEKENITRGKKLNRATFPEYRRYDLKSGSIKSPQSMAYDPKKSAFITEENGIVSKVYESWETSGFEGVFTHLSQSSEVPSPVKQFSDAMLTTLSFLQKLQDKVLSRNKISEELITEEFSIIPNLSKSTIRAFGVHPHVHSFAVAYQDDIVKIFSANRWSDFEPILKDKKQKDVSCLAFRPLSAAHIAVGCKTGIMFWVLDPNSSGMRPGANQHRFLSKPGHHPVTSLAWSGNGNLLASGSPADSSVMVWDVLFQKSTALRRLGPAICFLSWSPFQDCLFSSASRDMFRIWETRSWTCEKWSNLNGRCQAACWSPCQRYLLFAVENESSLYYLYFQKNEDSNCKVSTASGVAVKCFDFSEHRWEEGLSDVKVGGTLQSMTWDPTGSRLAMTFKDEGNPKATQRQICLFRTSLDPMFEIEPCGFITGYADEKPLAVSFLPNFDKGALLMVCWSNGMVSQVPLLFHTNHMSVISNQGAFELGSGHADVVQAVEDLHSVSS